MKRSLRLFTIAALLIPFGIAAQKSYTYTSVPGDPMEARIYTLDNGLQVWLSRNPDAPRVQTNIATRAGSKNDPADATGLAHYLEHMLFKGTSHIATVDWTHESVLLERISDQYELRRATTDEKQRAAIYHRIDSLSQLAAAYAIPNEYDKMVKSLGARGTNAYTSNERTVYVNDVPTDELEKWMMIESERFRECVLRLFHTELETVFEEFNRGQDNDYRNASQAMDKALWKKHPYGTQTTIGLGEHLKNPSMVKIQEYFHTWYVPNNMAVILAGDLDYDKTIAMVDKYFGGWRPKDVPQFSFTPEDPITTPVNVEVFGPMAEWVELGWRFGGTATADPIMLDLISGILSNGSAGLMDLDLVQQQKVLSASASAGDRADYSQFGMSAEVRQGQSLEQARDLLLAELEKVKQGDFDDWLIQAVVNDRKQQRIRFWHENNSRRAGAMTNAFILRKSWKEVVDYHDRMGRITKEQVIAFAQKGFTGNHVCVFKRTGENKDAFKVTKPPITAIDIKRDAQSAWRAEWEKVPETHIEPVFIDYKAAIEGRELKGGVRLDRVANPTNDLFTLNYIVEMGTNNDRKLGLAVNYLTYLGTPKFPRGEIKKELFKLGLRFSVSTGEDRVAVTLSGLEENLVKGVDLLEQVLAEALPDENALKELVSDITKERDDGLKDKSNILQNGLFSYARYGERSPLRNKLSTEEMRSTTPAELIERLHALTTYPHHIFYYGRKSADEVAALLNEHHRIPASFKALPPAQVFTEQPTIGNKVYYADFDMVQTELMMVSKEAPFDPALLPAASLFNDYFGSGLSSIVFQEIREAKALAYSANCSFTRPRKKEEAFYTRAYIGTQSDKLGNAVAALSELMSEMPMDDVQFEGAREAALKQIASDRITKERIYWSWDDMQRLGVDHDIRRDNYERIKQLTIQDLKAFFDANIKGRDHTYLVIGKETGLDMSALRQLGTVQQLGMMDLFGYEASEEVKP